MGNLTHDMTRLRRKIDSLRSDRGTLMQELARGATELASTVSAMQVDFAAARTAMAKQARGEREVFVATLVDEVNSLLSTFSKDRENMARKGRYDRGAFLSEMERQVTNLLKGTADDLMGIRLAWRGQSVRKPQQVKLQKEPMIVTPVPPIVEEAVRRKVEAPASKAEETPVTFRAPMKEEEKNTVAPPNEPIAAPKTPPTAAAKNEPIAAPKVNTSSTPVSSPGIPKHNEKVLPGKKPYKTVKDGKPGKK